MKRITLLLTLLSLLTGLQKIKAQRTQSAIYDAAALLNAQNGIGILLKPAQAGSAGQLLFDIIDPITGEVKLSKKSSVPDSLRQADYAKCKQIIYAILKRNAGLDTNATNTEVDNAYKDNPFINGIVKTQRLPLTLEVTSALANNNSGAGDKFLGNIMNGTADFLIKRAQEEIAISVFSRLQQFLSRYPEFPTLFPNTCSLIKPVAAYEYPKTLAALRGAIEEDVQTFTGNIPHLYNIPKYQKLNEEVPALTLVFSSAGILSELQGNKGIEQILQNLPSQPYLQQDNNYSSFLRLVVLISNSLRSKLLTEAEDADYPYVTAEEIASLSRKEAYKAEMARYYMGLLFQQCREIYFTTANAQRVSFAALLQSYATDANQLLSVFNSLAKNISAAQQFINTLNIVKQKEQDAAMLHFPGQPQQMQDRFTAYAGILTNIIGLVQALAGNDGSSPIHNLIGRIHDYALPFITDINGMVNAFEQKQYNFAISRFSHSLQTLLIYLQQVENDRQAKKKLAVPFETELNKQLSTITDRIASMQSELEGMKKKADSIITSQATGSTTSQELLRNLKAMMQQYGLSIELLKEEQRSIGWQKAHTNETLYKITKVIDYVNLLMSIALAEDGKQVEALLEATALPAGSSRIKKVTSWNIAVNAYVGGFLGRSETVGGFTNQYGLTAPIGIAVSKGLNKAGSLSAFFGAFDIGGIVRYKLDNQGAYQQDVSLAGVLSPSAHFVYGFPFNIPLAAGIGCQWTTPATPASKVQLSPHFNLFVAIDIPLFNLWARKKDMLIKPY